MCLLREVTVGGGNAPSKHTWQTFGEYNLSTHRKHRQFKPSTRGKFPGLGTCRVDSHVARQKITADVDSHDPIAVAPEPCHARIMPERRPGADRGTLISLREQHRVDLVLAG